MRSILKYEIQAENKIPQLAQILKIETDLTQGKTFVWVYCDPEAKLEKRYFRLCKTGEKLPDAFDDCVHLATLTGYAEKKMIVSHVWEIPAHVMKKASE